MTQVRQICPLPEHLLRIHRQQLSVPGVFGWVERPEEVTVRAQDRNGEWFEVTGVGLTARAFCHELDHLEGVLFTSLADHIMSEEELAEYYAPTDEEA